MSLKKSLIGFVLALLLSACGSDNQQQPAVERTDRSSQLEFTGTVTFLNKDGNEISTVQVVVADTPESRQTGLMDVHNLPADKGMIFIFEQEQTLRFWMASTPIPLDIIFVNQQYEIVRIHRNARPFSTRSYESESPAIFTVEVNGGYTSERDIQEGMRISIDL